jgi:hypothetical protein
MKKVLIIAGDFVPYSPSLGGVIRILTLADFLHKKGYDISIITSRSRDFGYFGYEDTVKKFHIEYVDNRLQAYIFKSAMDKKAVDKSQGKSGVDPVKKFLTAIKYRLKNLVYEFSVPDINIFMKSRFYKKAMSLILKDGIQNLIISSPPHSMQVVGTMIKRRLKDRINYIADYRDSWNTIRLFSKRNIISKAMSLRYEKAALLACDHFSFISNPMLTKAEKLYGIDIGAKSRLIMNGFVKEIPDMHETVHNDKIKIGYFGAISDSPNSMRNISRLLDLLSVKSGSFGFLEFHFYGDVTISHHDLSGLPMVFVHESLDHREALSKMLDMDFLLLVHSDSQSSDEVITGKFFEYVSAKKTILCLGPEDMEAKRLVEKYKVGVNIDIFDEADIEDKLMSLASIDRKIFYKDLDIGIFKRDTQYAAFLGILR